MLILLLKTTQSHTLIPLDTRSLGNRDLEILQYCVLPRMPCIGALIGIGSISLSVAVYDRGQGVVPYALSGCR